MFQDKQSKNGCPQLSGEVFEILKTINEILLLFKAMTLAFSAAASTIHDVLSSYTSLIRQLNVMANSVNLARKKPFTAAIAKLEKYYILALDNDWVCAAFGLFASPSSFKAWLTFLVQFLLLSAALRGSRGCSIRPMWRTTDPKRW